MDYDVNIEYGEEVVINKTSHYFYYYYYVKFARNIMF
jgi:hypothetical protein